MTGYLARVQYLVLALSTAPLVIPVVLAEFPLLVGVSDIVVRNDQRCLMELDMVTQRSDEF